MPEHEREVRFAVVIYGGVSLAIYINGIVQELLRMVRSTAIPKDQLKYSEKVYYKLACKVGLGDTADSREMDRAIRIYEDAEDFPRTKFVADIFSGTSAGGINALFCAKALATGESLDELAKLWIDVADIDKLLNDKRSVEAPLQLQKPPKSLLNAKWMYLQLLKAFTGMDKNAPPDARPLVGDLDVFLTATDLDGLPLPLALPHQKVNEKRHKNVFHFVRRDDGERDDFKHQPADGFAHSNNPFFAFAARCTSAFPFAFEPMALCDIFPIIEKLDEYKKHICFDGNPKVWQSFYRDYVGDAMLGETPFTLRSFGDGGYLDNKPFSYAIDTVVDRSADVPVDRKLIYIEPSPETISIRKRSDASDRPDAVDNSIKALVALPRYETVREDLVRLLEWNRNVARLQHVLSSVRDLIDTADLAVYRSTLAFQVYLRLRHSATVDAMTVRLNLALGIDPACSRANALRELIDAWIPASSSPAAIADLLDTYDFEYAMRALQYLRFRIRALKGSAEDAQKASSIKQSFRRAKEDKLTDTPIRLTDTYAADLDSIDSAGMNKANNAGGRIEARSRRVNDLLVNEGWKDLLDWANQQLKEYFSKILVDSRIELFNLLDKYGGRDRFNVQDSVVYPIAFGTCLGEFAEIDVLRISPQDVTTLEGVTSGHYSKIRGDAFGAFGGFLDRRWRKHDILRGRLDGAERLITAILPGTEEEVSQLRKQLIIEAQKEIAQDWKANYAEL